MSTGVADRAEAPEGLAQQAPPLDPHRPAQVFAVLDDLVSAEMSEQACCASGISPGIGPVDRRGGTCASLVKQDDAVVLEHRAQPARPAVAARAR